MKVGRIKTGPRDPWRISKFYDESVGVFDRIVSRERVDDEAHSPDHIFPDFHRAIPFPAIARRGWATQFLGQSADLAEQTTTIFGNSSGLPEST